LEFFVMIFGCLEDDFEWFGFEFRKNVVMADSDDFGGQVFTQGDDE
jgi:hypothetical protein